MIRSIPRAFAHGVSKSPLRVSVFPNFVRSSEGLSDRDFGHRAVKGRHINIAQIIGGNLYISCGLRATYAEIDERTSGSVQLGHLCVECTIKRTPDRVGVAKQIDRDVSALGRTADVC